MALQRARRAAKNKRGAPMALYHTGSAEETAALGERLGRTLQGGELIAFYGRLGAGKTTFCRGLARGMACTDPVSSPTYALVNVYRGPLCLAHFDAYRMQTADDVEAAGLYEWRDAGAVVAVEWSERIEAFLEPPVIRITMLAAGKNRRTITIEGAAAF